RLRSAPMATPRSARKKRRLGRPRNEDRRPGAPSTRERILAAAGALFAERGHEATTMEEVAASAGLTVGALYRHFDGKPDLLLAVVGDSLARIPLFHRPGAPFSGRVAELIGVYVTPELDTVRRLAREVHAAARRDASVRALLDAFNRQIRDAATSRIEDLPHATPVVSASASADLLLVMVLGLAHLDTLAPDRCDRPDFRAAVEEAVDRILGIATEASRSRSRSSSPIPIRSPNPRRSRLRSRRA
ncbi:MAG: TetR family transcriptional regulator, partial [Candidatus Binatia bacterium]